MTDVERININRVMEGTKKNLYEGRVLIAKAWFEVDAYSAAVTGILNSVELALGSGSLGADGEAAILCDIVDYLVSKDPDLALSERLSTLMEEVE